MLVTTERAAMMTEIIDMILENFAVALALSSSSM